MIWDYIRDFLVQYIFGGVTSSGDWYGGLFGSITATKSGQIVYEEVDTYTTYAFLNIGLDNDGSTMLISLGDWLSTTTTIIIMVLMVVLAVLLVRWIFRVVSSAMLLR